MVAIVIVLNLLACGGWIYAVCKTARKEQVLDMMSRYYEEQADRIADMVVAIEEYKAELQDIIRKQDEILHQRLASEELNHVNEENDGE